MGESRAQLTPVGHYSSTDGIGKVQLFLAAIPVARIQLRNEARQRVTEVLRGRRWELAGEVVHGHHHRAPGRS